MRIWHKAFERRSGVLRKALSTGETGSIGVADFSNFLTEVAFRGYSGRLAYAFVEDSVGRRAENPK
jgi:hypothetical protein